jgi:hypothetical protein
MPNQTQIKPFDDQILDVKKQSLYARLKRLFSTDVIVRNVGGKQLKIKDTDNIMYATDRNSLRDRFNRIRSTAYNAYTRDFAMSYQAARMDLFRDYDCVGPDTIIPLPDGSRPTIAELAEKYKNNPQERFWVFSYDHETDSIKLGKAYHPRKKKGVRQGYKITFDNGQSIIGSLKHPFLMRDGSKKRLFELRVGDSVMPFYEKEYGYNKHGFKRYRRLYNFSRGWQQEHKIVAEQFYRPLEKNEVIHHKNFNGSDNTPENLEIMDWKEHKRFHSDHNKNVLWGEKNYKNQLHKLKSHPNYVNRAVHHWNGERVGSSNPFYGKQHTIESNEKRSKSLKEAFINKDQTGKKNPNYRDDVTFDNVKQKAFEYYKEYSKINIWDFIKHIHCDHSTLQNRLKKEGHNWKSFKREVENTLNHKIISIESVGEVEVYDVTVEKYENFATDSCIVGNTMDMDPIMCSALDIYADECLTYNEVGKMITVHSNNNNVKRILENLFDEILNVRFNLWSWVRNMCKYGDFYLKLYITPEYGIYMVEPISAYNVERIENSDPSNKRYVKFQIRPTDTTQSEVLENYEVAHFRLINDSNFLPYGKSLIEGARRVWKQLSLMEDAMLIHRIMRAPEKRIFYTDIGNIPPNEVDAYMQKMMDKMKKIPYMDEQSGDYNLRFNLQNMVEDYYIPVRGGDSGTKIDTLGGMEWTGTEDIEYLRNKLMSALKIPKAFLGYEEGISGKATLASEDVRFARTIQRLQCIIASELGKIATVHLYAQGYRDESLVDFELELTNPSTIFEKEKVEIWSDKVAVATDMVENKFFSYKWAYKNIFNMSEDDIEKVREEIVEDAKQRYRFASIEEDGDDPAKPFKKIGGKGGDDEDGDKDIGDLGGGGGLGGGMHSSGGLGGSDLEDMDKFGEDGPGLDDLADIEGGNEEGEGDEDKETEDETGPEKSKNIKEYADPAKDRDQSGEHDARRDHPMAEDPLGQDAMNANTKTNSERKKKSAIAHNYEGGSPLSRLHERNKPVVDGAMIKSLSEFLNKTGKNIKTELLNEIIRDNPNNKSMMDESNILE